MAAVALAVFALVYALLAAPRLAAGARRAIASAHPRAGRVADALTSRAGVAAAGALLVVALGALAPRAAWAAIDWRVLAQLAGMMLLVAALETANAFGVLASRLVLALRTPARLLAGSMLAVAILSALVLNDAVVLLFTPVLVRAARAMGASPFPFLAGEAIAANLGSAATPVGNPQNAAIALSERIAFVDFAAALAPIAAIALALGVVACLVAFRRELAQARPADVPPPERVTHPAQLVVALLCVAGALGGFVAGPAFGIELWGVALAAGLAALLLSATTRVGPVAVARRVDPGILVFFVGLFVLLEAVRGSGALDRVADALQSGGRAGYVAAVAILSNVFSNVPAVLLLLPSVETQPKALLLAVSSTFAGNATFLGSAATVIVAETARQHGASFSVGRFTLVGLPVAAATLALAWWLAP